MNRYIYFFIVKIIIVSFRTNKEKLFLYIRKSYFMRLESWKQHNLDKKYKVFRLDLLYPNACMWDYGLLFCFLVLSSDLVSHFLITLWLLKPKNIILISFYNSIMLRSCCVVFHEEENTRLGSNKKNVCLATTIKMPTWLPRLTLVDQRKSLLFALVASLGAV